MVHTFTAKAVKRYRYYKCSHAIQSGYDTCPTPALRAPEIEAVVVGHIRQIAGDKDFGGYVEICVPLEKRSSLRFIVVGFPAHRFITAVNDGI